MLTVAKLKALHAQMKDVAISPDYEWIGMLTPKLYDAGVRANALPEHRLISRDEYAVVFAFKVL